MDLIERVYRMQNDVDVVSKYSSIVEKSKDIDDLRKLYDFVKSVSTDFYNGHIAQYYNVIGEIIQSSEELFMRDYILPISFKVTKGEVINSGYDEYDILNYLVNEVRKHLLNYKLGKKVKIKKQVSWNADFANYCFIASKEVKELCDFLGIKCYVVSVWPGFDEGSNLFNGNGYHYFNIVHIGDKSFLLDVTYKQFFSVGLCDLGRIGLMNYSLPKAGRFIIMSEFGEMIATKLLRDGYIELDSKVFKAYMDAFAVSFRNGLYYEETNDYSYTTDYSVNDYINFLTGQDSQVKQEGKDVLGYQKRPIKI